MALFLLSCSVLTDPITPEYKDPHFTLRECTEDCLIGRSDVPVRCPEVFAYPTGMTHRDQLITCSAICAGSCDE